MSSAAVVGTLRTKLFVSFSVFLSEGLYMEPSQVAEHENGGLAHMPGTKVFPLPYLL